MSRATLAGSYTSSNLQKHSSGNPLQRLLLGRFHRAAAGLLAEAGAGTLLDAGCGEGIAMGRLLTDGRRAVGLDGSLGALSLAASLNPKRSFAAGDLLALPFSDDSFDVVMCLEVLEHLAEPAQGLAELRRVSRRWLVLSVPDEPLFRGANFLRGKNVRAWGNDPGHVNHWSASGFVRFVESACTVVRSQRSFPWTLVLASVA